jgi:hypothetical protein
MRAPRKGVGIYRRGGPLARMRSRRPVNVCVMRTPRGRELECIDPAGTEVHTSRDRYPSKQENFPCVTDARAGADASL